MINLLPPALKDQVRYAKLNRLMLRYLRSLILIMLIIAGIFIGTIFYLNLQATAAQQDVTEKQTEIAATAKFQASARDISDRLAAIKFVQASQTRFSTLLDDLAKVLPKGVSIDSITLTGSDKQPVRITVAASSYDQILSFREAFALSPRISGVDLENISQSGTTFQAAVVIGFKPGQAK